MRVAVISDIHANLHALEAVRGAIEQEAPDEVWCLGDLVGYGPQPNECCDVVGRARRRLPGRQPRPRRARHARHLATSSDDAPPRRLDARRARESAARRISRARRRARARGRRPLPREPARPGLGVRARAGGGARPRSTIGLAVARRPQPRAARAPGDRARPGGHAPGGTRSSSTAPLAAQPRLGRPAARRRPARGLAAARPRRAAGVVPTGGVRRRADPGRDPRAGLPEALAERLATASSWPPGSSWRGATAASGCR